MKAHLLRLTFLLCMGIMLYTATLGVTAPALADQGGLNTAKIEPALLKAMQASPRGNFSVIVETALPGRKPARTSNNDRAKGAVDRLKSNGAKSVKSLAIIGGGAGNLNVDGIAKLSRDPFVTRILSDRKLKPLGTPAELSIYAQLVRAPDVWAQGINGSGITIAVLDSGIAAVDDLLVPVSRIVASVDLTPNPAAGDPGGHGTHVAGIIAGNGGDSSQARMGIAPNAKLVSVRVIGADGTTSASTVIRGIEWVVQNRSTYNIRVLNLSIGGTAAMGYRSDPLAAAVEMAWQSGIVVVASAGNSGPDATTIVTPGADPYVITVGAMDDAGTLTTADDTIAPFSSRGPTGDGFHKPDLLAPGRRIVSLRASGSTLDNLLPDRVTDTNYFRLSGTSQSAPVVSGTAALMLQKNPTLRPNQIKALLKQTAHPVGGGNADNAGAGVVDAYAAVNAVVSSTANTSLRPSNDFAMATYPMLYGMQLHGLWRDLGYQGINWANITWDNITWDNITWDNITWDNITWDNITWSNITWDNITWDNITWDASISGDSMNTESVGWQSVGKLN